MNIREENKREIMKKLSKLKSMKDQEDKEAPSFF